MEIQNSKDWAKVYRACGFIEKGVCEYADERVYLSEETLIKSLHTIKGRPVIIDHMTGITPENMNEHAVGYVVGYDSIMGTGAGCDCEFVIFDDEGKKVIADGYSVSCAYKPKSFGPGGTWHNVPYDREITDLEYTHLALVQNPRYEDAKVYENAKDGDDKGRWITIKGTHVFVKDGQSVEDAMKDTFKSSPTEKKEEGGKQKEKSDLEGKYKGKDKYDPTELTKDIKKAKEEGRVDDVMDYLGIEEAEEGTAFLGAELEGKYERDDVDWDPKQLEKDIKKAQSLGHKSVEDVASFLGLDEDEVRETIGEGDRSGSSFDEEGWKKSVEANKQKEQKSKPQKPNIGDYKFKNYQNPDAFLQGHMKQCETIKDTFEYVLSETDRKFENVKKTYWGNTPPAKQFRIELGNINGHNATRDIMDSWTNRNKDYKPVIDDIKAYQQELLSQLEGYNQWNGKEWVKEKHNSTEELKEDTMKVDEFFNKMGEMIEEKLNACKSKMNEGDEEEKEDDDDKFEMDGETYSKKELVNAWKEKKNTEESEEKSDEESEEKSEEKSNEAEDEDEKQNSGDEFFNAMEKRMQQQADASDKIEIYSQAKGLEKGRSIYTK